MRESTISLRSCALLLVRSSHCKHLALTSGVSLSHIHLQPSPRLHYRPSPPTRKNSRVEVIVIACLLDIDNHGRITLSYPHTRHLTPHLTLSCCNYDPIKRPNWHDQLLPYNHRHRKHRSIHRRCRVPDWWHRGRSIWG